MTRPTYGVPLQHALVLNVPLNVPLNNVLNHRFFAVMSAGVPQVVFGDPGLVGEHRQLAEPERLRTIPVAPPMRTGVLRMVDLGCRRCDRW